MRRGYSLLDVLVCFVVAIICIALVGIPCLKRIREIEARNLVYRQHQQALMNLIAFLEHNSNFERRLPWWLQQWTPLRVQRSELSSTDSAAMQPQSRRRCVASE